MIDLQPQMLFGVGNFDRQPIVNSNVQRPRLHAQDLAGDRTHWKFRAARIYCVSYASVWHARGARSPESVDTRGVRDGPTTTMLARASAPSRRPGSSLW